MPKKTVRDLIFDKFAEAIGKDDLFNGISDGLERLVRGQKPSKTEIENLLRRERNENIESRNQ